MNARQKKILGSWRRLLRGFVKREWFSLFLSSGLGILVAEFVHLVSQDLLFESFLASHYKPSVSFDDPKYYIPYLVIILIAFVLATGALLPGYIWRGVKSWWEGVTSGLLLLPFISAFLFSILPPSYPHNRLLQGCILAGVWFLSSFGLSLIAAIRAERTIREDEL